MGGKRESKSDSNRERNESAKEDIVDLTNKSQDALSFKDKSAAFSDLLNNHIYWTRFFTWLEANTLNTVKYSGFSGDLSGSYTLGATAPSFAEASWQVKILTNSDEVKNVSVNSVTSNADISKDGQILEELETETVSFSIGLEINPEIFKKK